MNTARSALVLCKWDLVYYCTTKSNILQVSSGNLKQIQPSFKTSTSFLKPSNCLKLNQHYQKIFMPRFRSILENHISRNLKQIFPAEFQLPLQEVGHGNSNLTEIRITKLKELTYSLGGNSEEPESMNEVLYLHVS